ncbi:hypothetical protein CMI44_02110 [Candidatus Pacearchaeota archaeon]|nr:hypothetical protein [Candidatus Pacearchaeota archaeon]|tara:strand:- start:149 stop:826 length:678 start_codon:yes stop_codon:yes gene_type:complete
MKAIIFDASTLISFATACLYEELRKLKKSFNGYFIITNEIKKEIIDKPMRIPRFQLEGIKIKQLLDEGVLELSNAIGVKDSEIVAGTKKIMEIANSTFSDDKGNLKLISEGEASCIALSKILNEKKIPNVLAIDERIMRSLCETPDGLKKHLGKKMHTKIKIKKENLNFFKEFKIIRSIELAYVAYKKGFVKVKGKSVLGSLINALRFKGASASNEEIDEIKRMG